MRSKQILQRTWFSVRDFSSGQKPRIHRSLEAANSPAEGTAANSPGKAVIIKRASPGWEEALFIIGFALPYLLLAEEEGDHCQKQESGITGVASAAAAT